MSPRPRLTYALIPGAGGESWYWHLVVPLLRARGHEVVAPDLPWAEPGAGPAEFADTVVGAIGDSAPVVIVAQSMGAYTAPIVCDSVHVDELILVCPMIPAPGETAGDWWGNTGQTEVARQQALSEGRDADGSFDLMTGFFHDVPDDVVREAFDRGEPPQSDSPFTQPWPLASWPDVPTRVIAGRNDRLFPLPFVRRIARERLGLEVDVIDTGHLPALAQPDELTRRLDTTRQNGGAPERPPA